MPSVDSFRTAVFPMVLYVYVVKIGSKNAIRMLYYMYKIRYDWWCAVTFIIHTTNPKMCEVGLFVTIAK